MSASRSQTAFSETLKDGAWDGGAEVQTVCPSCLAVVSPAFGARSGSRAVRLEWQRALSGSSRGCKSTEAITANKPRLL